MIEKDYYTFDKAKDILFGKRGTKMRDDYEDEVEVCLIGLSIKETRKAQNLTQKELGEKIGIKSAQISKIKNGRNITIATIIKVLKTVGLTADSSIHGLKQVILGLCK